MLLALGAQIASYASYGSALGICIHSPSLWVPHVFMSIKISHEKSAF